MPDNKWEKLETELVKDFWGKSEACHIFAGLIRVVRRESIKPSLQIVEEKQTIRAKEREQDRIKEVWDGTDHQPKGREIRSNGFTEEYSVAYCIRWAQKKRINIPWLNWAIKEGYIKAEDLEPENNNADADRVPGSDAAVTEEVATEEVAPAEDAMVTEEVAPMTDEATAEAAPADDAAAPAEEAVTE